MGKPPFDRRSQPVPWPLLSLAFGVALLAGATCRGQVVVPPERLEKRNALAWEVIRLREAGKVREALAAAESMLEVERGIFGAGHEDLAGALEFAAGAYSANGDFEAAAARLREALSIRESALGREHPLTTDLRFALERIERLVPLDGPKRARYREGTRLIAEANRIGRRSYQVAKQIETMQQALVVLKDALGEGHPEYAVYLDQLGWIYRGQSRMDKGNPYNTRALDQFRQALEIRERALGAQHPEVAKSLDYLANLPAVDEAPEVPLERLRRALAVREASQGARHPDVARAMARVVDHLARMEGGRDEAIALGERALAIVASGQGNDDPIAGNLLQTMAKLYREAGDKAREEQVLRRRVEVQEARIRRGGSLLTTGWIGRLGPSPDAGTLRFAQRWTEFAARLVHATALGELSRFHGENGNLGRAAQYLREAMNAYADNVERQAAVSQGGNAFDPMAVGPHVLALERFLALSREPGAEITPEEAYRQVLSWKGGYFAYELQARRWRARPELAPLVRELQRAADELGRAALAAPAPQDRAGWERIIHWLSERDQLERDLADRVSRLSSGPSPERPDVERLKASLPGEAALVDFKVFATWTGWDSVAGDGSHLMAFVVRRNGPVVRIDLGPWKPIADAIGDWRTYGLPPFDPRQPKLPETLRRGRAEQAMRLLRASLWAPLEPHVAGSSTLLVAPDSALCRFPMAALPGMAPGSFLIEDLAVAVVPVPRLLQEGRPPAFPAMPPPGLLAVGDVDFDAEPGVVLAAAERAARGLQAAGAAPRARLMKFGPLPSTGHEVDAVQALFSGAFPGGQAVSLRGTAATEGAFRRALGRSRYVHLATHGFFEPPELASRQPTVAGDDLAYWSTPQGLARRSPGLLSGVAFAGANRPPSAQRDDGILTAVEAQQLDLSGVDLVVLSACETALGSQAHGEGLMGLQRAFQVAGARTLVSSLWPVDDAATALLMEEFYTNLWQRRLSKLEALRRAQTTILTRYDPVGHVLLPEGQGTGRMPPFLWAPFTLSGDWR